MRIEPTVEYSLGQRGGDVAEIAGARTRREAALHREAVGHPRVHVQFQALPVRRHVAVVAGERQVVVDRAERGPVVPQDGRTPAVRSRADAGRTAR